MGEACRVKKLPCLRLPFVYTESPERMACSASLVTKPFLSSTSLSIGAEITLKLTSLCSSTSANIFSCVAVVGFVVPRVRLPFSHPRVLGGLTLVKDRHLRLHQVCKAVNLHQALRHAFRHCQLPHLCRKRSLLMDRTTNL